MTAYPETRCFLIEPTDRARVFLRRYASGSTGCPASGMGYHDARRPIGECSMRSVTDEDDGSVPDPEPVERDHPAWALLCHAHGHAHWAFGEPEGVDHADPRWPAACDCGYRFAEADEWQVFKEPVYAVVAPGTRSHGVETTLRDAAPGAMWNADWMPSSWKAADCRSLVVKCPNGHEWTIDMHASNCDSPCASCGRPYNAHDWQACRAYRDSNPGHKCWCRHGEPPDITVDKDCVTCGAGAGSIMAGDYHGFLRGGVFTAQP